MVLLSAVDHYERTIGSSSSGSSTGGKRSLGVILGESGSNKVKILNSFGIPFEEEGDIWFLDHNFIINMFEMFKKINAKEKIVGWYHTGGKLYSNDLIINEMFKQFVPKPLLLVVDVQNTKSQDEIPINVYESYEEIKEDGTNSTKTFLHHRSIIEAEEAEEIGVEHLLRDIKDENSGKLTIKLSNNFKSLNGLKNKLELIVQYLNKVQLGSLSVNNEILGKIQEIFNLLPNLEIGELNQSFNGKTNDELMVIYVSSLVRSILAFHDLIDNKIQASNSSASA